MGRWPTPHFVFDKTGTLTAGRMAPGDAEPKDKLEIVRALQAPERGAISRGPPPHGWSYKKYNKNNMLWNTHALRHGAGGRVSGDSA